MKGGCGRNERCRVGGLYALVRGNGGDIAGPQAPLSVQKREQGHGGGGEIGSRKEARVQKETGRGAEGDSVVEHGVRVVLVLDE